MSKSNDDYTSTLGKIGVYLFIFIYCMRTRKLQKNHQCTSSFITIYSHWTSLKMT